MNTEENIQQILIDDIIPNRFQPRLAFDEEGLKELSESIKQHGIIQPLVLRRLGNKFEIIAGERRYKAATMAGLKTVPAIISNIDDNQSAEIALVENIQRRNLTAIEEAKSYKNLLDRGYLTQEQLAQKMGVSQSTIANKLRLLNLSQEVQDALLQEKISERHARSLLAIPKEEQNEWLKKIISKRMTVRQLDLEIKKAKGGPSEEIPEVKEETTPDLNNMINNNIAKEEKLETINNLETDNNDNEDSANARIPNKFFNFLEDEAANMNMGVETAVNTSLSENQEAEKEIETLDDFDIPTEEPTNNIMPLFFNNDDSEINNTIEEVPQTSNEPIIDPLDSVIKLDTKYEEQQKEKEGMSLKTVINDMRQFVTELENKGFVVQIEELDLENNYQFTINIQK